MAGWRRLGNAALVCLFLLAGCVGGGSDPATMPSDEGNGTADENVEAAANRTLFRFERPDGPFNASMEDDGAIPLCPGTPCEGDPHPLPQATPAGLAVVIELRIVYDASGNPDPLPTAELRLDDGEVLSSRNDWSEDGVTVFSAVFEIASGSGEVVVRSYNLLAGETPYQLSGFVWADPTIVPHGEPVRLDLVPGTNLSVEGVIPPHDDDGHATPVEFVLYDDDGQPVARYQGEESNVTIEVPADAPAGRPYSLVPTTSGFWARLWTDGHVPASMERFELERTYGPAHLLASAEAVSWSEDVDEVPVRAGVYLRSDAAWVLTPIEGRVLVSSPAGAVVDREYSCPPPVLCVGPSAIDFLVASSTGDPLLVPGTYDFEAARGGSAFTHAGTYLVTLPG